MTVFTVIQDTIPTNMTAHFSVLLTAKTVMTIPKLTPQSLMTAPIMKNIQQKMLIPKNFDDSNIPDKIHVLTLKEPWVYHILNSGKDVENRSWKLWNGFTGVAIALHSGKTIDKVLPKYQVNREKLILGKIQAFVIFDGLNAESEWAIRETNGKRNWNWKIMETWAIPDPIPAIGKQGLWTVPRSIGLSDLWNDRGRTLKRVYQDGDNQKD